MSTVCVKGLSHCHEFGYDIRRFNNSPQIIVEEMSPYVGCCRTLSPYLVYCRAYEMFKPFKNLASGRSYSHNDLAAHPYNAVRLSYTLSPIVVCSRVFSQHEMGLSSVKVCVVGKPGWSTIINKTLGSIGSFWSVTVL